MTKKDLIKEMAEKSGLTQKVSTAAVDALIATVGDVLAKGDEISIVGFGKFYVSERGERHGRNPQTGEDMIIKASKLPKFKAGKALKDLIKNA